MANKYRFVRLPITDGDDGKVKVGTEVLGKKDLGKIIETNQDLDDNVHFKRVLDKPMEEDGGIAALPDAEISPVAQNIPDIVKSEESAPDFLERDQGFLLPPETEKKVKKVVKKRIKKSSRKKITPKAPKNYPEPTSRVYTVSCYQCGAEFKKRTSQNILSFNPWEIVCSVCKKKKK